MPFQEQLPEWNAAGVEPPASKKNTGWQAGEKPPADYWNWQMNRTYKALQELQQKAAEKEEVESVAQAADQAWGQAVLARSIAELHAARHATGGPDEITPEMIGAETPAGAQEKADQAEANAKAYADGNFTRVIRLPHNNMGSTEYVKIAELMTDVGASHNNLILHVNGTSDFGNNTPGSDVVQVSTRGGVGLRAYTFLPQGTEDIRYGYVNNSTTGRTEIWLRRDPWCQATQIIVAQASNVLSIGVLAQQTTEPSGITYVNKDAFATKTQESWINATLLNSWVNYGSGWAPASYFKDQFGIVRLRGMIRNGTVTQGTTILILPSGYRPASDISFLVPSGDGTSDTLGRLVVDTSGNVRVSSASNYYLDLSGISFRTA